VRNNEWKRQLFLIKNSNEAIILQHKEEEDKTRVRLFYGNGL
jgi:hypothetical protein